MAALPCAELVLLLPCAHVQKQQLRARMEIEGSVRQPLEQQITALEELLREV
jgi:hypothetical protein